MMPETLTATEAIRRFRPCAYKGHEVVDVYEPAERYEQGLPPNRSGCVDCSHHGDGPNTEMVRIDWRR